MKKILLTLSSICLLGTSIFADSNTTISPQQILAKSLMFISKIDTYKIKANSENLLVYGKEVRSKYTNKFDILVDRPSKARIKITGDTKNREYYFNNGEYTLYNKEDVVYWGDMTVPKTTDKAIDYLLEKYGEEQPVSILLYSNIAKIVQPNSITYFGKVMKNGKECYHIGFKAKDRKRDVHVWIKVSEAPLIIAYTIIQKNNVNEYRINIDLDWELNPKVSNKDFIFNNKKAGQKIKIDIRRTSK